ncbi:MAG: FeoA family protein [Anaerolineae bacterium]
MNMWRRVFFPGSVRHHASAQQDDAGQRSPDGIVSLRELPAGCSGRIIALTGGHGLVARLAALGFTPGVTVTMLQNPGHGPVIVLARNTRLVLGRGEAGHVAVEKSGCD